MIYDRRGMFSVKSAYKVARESCMPVALQASSSCGGSAYQGLWQAIWRARVPPKVKMCGWRICSDILPTRANLLQKGGRLVVSCPRCDAPVVSASHVFKECSFACAVWSASPTG